MPDPRHQRPQRPMPPARQPAAQPPRAQTPSPAAPARPIRMLAPHEQAPPLEHQRKLRKGEVYWIVGHEHLDAPRKGKIIRLSNEPGKRIGVEFEEPVGGVDESGNNWGVNHSCDGHGKLGHCLYVGAEQALDDKAKQLFEARKAEVVASMPQWEEVDELTVGPTEAPPLTPGGNGSGREQMTIGREDVDTLELGDED